MNHKLTTRLSVILLVLLLHTFIPSTSAQTPCAPGDPPGEFPALPEALPERTSDLTEAGRILADDIGEIQSLALSPDGLFAVALGEYGLYLLNPTNGHVLYTICEETVNVALSPDARTLVLMSEDAVQLRDVYNGEIVAELEESWTAAAFTPDGYFIIVQDVDGVVSVRDIVSLDIAYTVEDVLHFAASPAGDFLAVATDAEVQILDLVSGDEITTLEVGDIATMKFNRSGGWLATVGEVVTVWEVDSWEPAFEIEVEAAGISFDPLDEFIAITSEDGLELWELESGSLIHEFECEDCGAVLAHSTGVIITSSAHLIFAQFSP
ncbi:MAG: WD40 repeat domain-containing protein [Chloroflexi bacterium]|nr:WD40 repeat domain-containing protein [Chloroflexota bacterium]